MTTLPTDPAQTVAPALAPSTAASRPAKRRRPLGTASWYVTALFVSSVMVVPLLWMITIGLKSRTAVFEVPPRLLPREFNWSNFIEGPQAINFGRLLLNSSVITALSVLGGVLTAMMAGYALARLRFPGRKVWFYLFVGSMLLPGVVGLIPLFQLYKSIGWYDTWLPLIVPAFFGGNPLFIFLARQYFLAIPYSIDEAAKIDGAGHFRIFTQVMLPLTRPAWITMAILAFQASWNDFLNPLVYLYSADKWPLSVGMASFISPFAGQTPDWSYYMATNLLYMLPPLILFFAAQRYFIQGLGSLGSTTQK
ncbi:carbohydrate ABC transporter permease [Kribbella sp. CA-253562]|uniref:carbohydrate ABC transporter permease n=1 Tax=Kribbella sp. CA-253562 TaxID=3239942 RepID=UPI003D8F48B8